MHNKFGFSWKWSNPGRCVFRAELLKKERKRLSGKLGESHHFSIAIESVSIRFMQICKLAELTHKLVLTV